MVFGPGVPDGYGCCYNPQNSRLNFGITAFNMCCDTDSDKFAKVLRQSLMDMHDLLASAPQESKLWHSSSGDWVPFIGCCQICVPVVWCCQIVCRHMMSSDYVLFIWYHHFVNSSYDVITLCAQHVITLCALHTMSSHCVHFIWCRQIVCPLYVAVRQCAILQHCWWSALVVRLSALVGACQIVCPCCGISDCLPMLWHVRLSALVAAHQIVHPCCGTSDCLPLWHVRLSDFVVTVSDNVCCFFLLCCVFEKHARFTSGIWLYRCVLYLDYKWNNDKVWCDYWFQSCLESGQSWHGFSPDYWCVLKIVCVLCCVRMWCGCVMGMGTYIPVHACCDRRGPISADLY